MGRLPVKKENVLGNRQRIWSVALSEDLEVQMLMEMERIEVTSKSELMRMIFEEYFKQEI